MQVTDSLPASPYARSDSTRNWIESLGREDGKIKPSLVIRTATDTNYLLNRKMVLYGDNPTLTNSNAVMNLAMPGQRIPGIQNWQVQESADSPVATASFEVINALPISTVEGVLQNGLSAEIHSPHIRTTHVLNSLFVVRPVNNNNSVESQEDPITGYGYREDNVKYREFYSQTFVLNAGDGAKFPQPEVRFDDDGKDAALTYPGYVSPNGSGNYYVLIDDEVIRVSKKDGDIFYVMPGGRGVNGIIQPHGPGARVRLLGLGPLTPEHAAFGYLAPDDFKPQRNVLRPGTCLVSYEGYGKLPASLSHTPSQQDNYAFTGYWFVRGLESSLGEDMIPRVRVDLVGAGDILQRQKITPDLVQRIRTQFGQWRVGENQEDIDTIWGAAGHTRQIPGDWVDYNNWDPTLRDSYPLKIKTEFAQHKEFFDHMHDTNMGLDCDLCMQERKEWVRAHENVDLEEMRRRHDNMEDSDPEKGKLAQRISDLDFQSTRAIGRHIYKQSIRVMQDEGGPILTYIRLIATMAAAAWDHPAYGTEISQMFSKIPNELYDNMRDVYTGLVFNGQIDFSALDTVQDWTKATYDDRQILGRRKPVTCPFESTYDKSSFYEPMTDLADVNGSVFWINRRGQPVFVPKDFPFRPPGENYQWFLSYGGSISAYSHSLNADAVVTQCWVSAKTAFDTEFTIAAGGTGFSPEGRKILFSPIAGNKDGLALTAGVQQVETVSMENQTLGLDWNTKVENWGLVQELSGSPGDESRDIIVNALPAFYDGSPEVGRGSSRKSAVERVQKLVNFFLIRRYISPIARSDGKSFYTIYENGDFAELTEKGVVDIQTYLINNVPADQRPTPLEDIQGERSRKNYGRATYLWAKTWLTEIGEHYIKYDIWWYVQNGRDWREYVGAITGIHVPLRRNSDVIRTKRTSRNSLEIPLYNIDDKGLQEAVSEWHKNFAKSAINVGNRIVDDSINKATVRSISVSMADPRIQPGDVIWSEVPGHLTALDQFGRQKAPFRNGIFVTSVSRQYDYQTGTYQGTYSGYRYLGQFGVQFEQIARNMENYL